MKKTLVLLSVAAVIHSCKPDLDVPKPSTGSADMSRMISLGDDYMAGYQDGALYHKGQQLSIPALIARQRPQLQEFIQPLMPDDYGIGYDFNPYSNNYVTRSILGYHTDCNGVAGLFPQASAVTPQSATGYFLTTGSDVHNFSVPFLIVKDYFNPAAGNVNGNKYYHRFASSPGTSTVYSDAKAANATFFTAWLGMADIYEYARHGGVNSTIISPSDFSLYLDSILHGLTANGAKGAIANIPALENFPFYTLIPWNGLALDSSNAATLNQATSNFFGFIVGNNGFVMDCPSCPSVPFRKMVEGEYILLDIPTDSLKCGQMGSFFGIPNVYVLDSTEMDSIHSAITAFNGIIAEKANQYNLALVDMEQYFKTVKAGILWDGVDLNADFISGGFFSLDGYHPNQKGYALIATEFIKAINNKYGSALPPVYCSECDGVRFP
jgi:hypothetical protein